MATNPYEAFLPKAQEAAPGSPPASAAPAAPAEQPPVAPPEETGTPLDEFNKLEQTTTNKVGAVVKEAGKGFVEGAIIDPVSWLGKSFTELTGISIAPETSRLVTSQ